MTLIMMTIMTSIMFSMLFLKLKHPLAMGLVLIIQTINVCMNTDILSFSPWFSYILFLIFMGALLVLFIYVATLAPNSLFKMPVKTLLASAIFIMTATLLTTTVDSGMIMSPCPSYPVNDLMNLSPPTQDMLKNLFNPTAFSFTTFIILFLLLTLIVVVNLSAKHHGPLRKN